MAQQEKCNKDSRHVDACTRNLTVPLLNAKMRTDAQKKDGSADGIDNRDECYERHTNPWEKIIRTFQNKTFINMHSEDRTKSIRVTYGYSVILFLQIIVAFAKIYRLNRYFS